MLVRLENAAVPEPGAEMAGLPETHRAFALQQLDPSKRQPVKVALHIRGQRVISATQFPHGPVKKTSRQADLNVRKKENRPPATGFSPLREPRILHDWLPSPMEPALPFTTCPVLFHDESLVVVEKPDGVLSHPNPRPGRWEGRSRSAFEGTYDADERRFDTPGGPVWLVHRLDQGTSGVLLAALNPACAARCREAFESGQVEKNYLALLSGILPPHGTWKDALIERRSSGRVRVVVRPGVKPDAELHFRTTASSPRLKLCLLELRLITGRTHQIRVQAATRHRPVLGDDVYGDFSRNRWARRELGLRRMFLHAASLTLPHPKTGRPLALRSPLPADLVEVLNGLKFEVPSL